MDCKANYGWDWDSTWPLHYQTDTRNWNLQIIQSWQLSFMQWIVHLGLLPHTLHCHLSSCIMTSSEGACEENNNDDGLLPRMLLKQSFLGKYSSSKDIVKWLRQECVQMCLAWSWWWPVTPVWIFRVHKQHTCLTQLHCVLRAAYMLLLYGRLRSHVSAVAPLPFEVVIRVEDER